MMLDLRAQSLVSTIMVRTTGRICTPFLPSPGKIQAEAVEGMCTKQKNTLIVCLCLTW